jgi:hypothetical protein
MTPEQAQKLVDKVSRELNDLYRQVREKEAERAKYDRIANPDEDYNDA